MAAIFHTPTLINGNGNNWKALPALPSGVDPMRRVILIATNTATPRVSTAFRFGHCTANQATTDAGDVYSLGRVDLGVVDYNKITVRDNTGGASNDTAYIYVLSFASTDFGPTGVS